MASALKTLIFAFLLTSISSVSARPLSNPSVVVDVRDYGAVGDGRSDDTLAFEKAWAATCKSSSLSSSSSATMVVPSSMTFLVHPLYLEGPCKPSRVNIEINGDIVAPEDPSSWLCEGGICDKWIHVRHVDGLSVYGFGKIHGRGENWWNLKRKTKPAAFVISNSNDVCISGLTFLNNPRMHLIFRQTRTVQVSNITIDAPEDSPNTDGIHISGSTDVSVDHCNIATGDDCISIVSKSSNIKVNNIICGPGHGISIGSLGKHGAHDEVEYVHVRDAVFRGSSNGVRIKTWQGGSGYARNIIFERILSQNSRNPIIIDQFYCDHETCVTSESAVKVSNVTFREIVGAPMIKKAAVTLDCSATVPCTDIVFENVDLRSRDGSNAAFRINNAHGRIQGEAIPRIPLLN